MASATALAGDEWRAFSTVAQRSEAQDDNLYQIADVWAVAQYGSLVSMTFSSASGDWIAFVDYCFAPDGGLTTVESELRTHHGGMIVNRRWTFDSTGAETAGPTIYRDLDTGLPTDADGPQGRGFQDFDVPFFESIWKLPFSNLLGQPPGVDASGRPSSCLDNEFDAVVTLDSATTDPV